MVKKTIIIISLLILIGCGKTEKEIQYVEKPIYVEVPVTQKIELTLPPKPKNYIKNIKKDSTYKEIVESYVNTIREQKNYIKKLEKLISPFLKN